ncbi:pyridoxal phosphate-dependent transferase [Aspergillus alliaceus]|uniref:Pyridoxal phosphate-dependent transferase n=1 Tax=Petromyces alliaceus TaxID=209559 RepID=A0A5N7C4N8_PETAA|nr:pyridoxal phosphate-dependent transferase [Aspergillus alliaceus]
MVFSSAKAAQQCATTLKAASMRHSVVEVVEFVMSPASDLGDGTAYWAQFSATLFPDELWSEAMAFWRDTGAGISTRQAPFCLEELCYLESKSSNPAYQTSSPCKRENQPSSQLHTSVRSTLASETAVKSYIAQLVTSEQPGQPLVQPGDVFLYPNGTNAIYLLSQMLASSKAEPTVVAYGWLYPETVKALHRCAWTAYISYKYGTEEELDQLESMLASGRRIDALFCELPSNIKLSSPNIFRIQALAERYGFIIVCDDTVAGYVNIDVLPYVDVIVSSLTKTFSGASNVTGGGLVVNPGSRHYSRIHATLCAEYESTFFPMDVDVLRNNSKDLVWRMKRCSDSALYLVDLFQSHTSIAQVNHPSTSPTRSLYRRLMREGGSYGNVLSVVFREPRNAEHFYNTLNVCKGTSFGANFTLALPYVQLANYLTRDKVGKYGVPQHIIRLSVGLEDKEQLLQVVAAALAEVERLEES